MQKKIRNKKVLSILLSLCLAAGCVGGIAGTSEFSETVLAETPVTYLDENGEEQSYTGSYTMVDSSSAAWGDGNETWYVVSGDVTISDRITVSGSVNLILEDGCSLTAEKGIAVNSGNSLVIYGQSLSEGSVTDSGSALVIAGPSEDSSGKLTATAVTAGDAGIGGSAGNGSGSITINGGAITATGKGDSSTGGAGIGGGSSGAGSYITINGGTVTAKGYGSAGVGGGSNGAGSYITINGGTVMATGVGGAGIGGGGYGAGSNITISGGIVYAYANAYGAGVGGGANGAGSDITISGGTLQAISNYTSYNVKGYGIGGGYGSSGSQNITISGGHTEAYGNQGTLNASNIVITGGYFYKSYNIYTDLNKVYNCEVADGYRVIENPDTNSIWKYIVIKETSSVTLNLDGGTITNNNVTSYTYGTGATLPTADDVTYTGSGEYIFDGWYENSDYTGESVTSISDTDYGDKTYYARFKKKNQTVTFDSNSGSCETSEISVIYGETYGTLPTPVREGYVFTGWYTEMDGGTEVTSTTVVTAADDHTLYAEWIYCDYLVAYTSGSLTYSDNVLEITSGGTYTISLNTYAGVTKATTDRIKVNTSEAVTIILTDVTATNSDASPFEISSTGEVTLVLSGTNSLTSTSDSCAGLQNGSSSSLIITSDEGADSDSGSLTAAGGSNAAGIGGGSGSTGGTVTIEGGTVTAAGGSYGAGIGGGNEASSGTITISGGTVIATGNSGGAGIGGGTSGSGGNITISGGTVTATGSSVHISGYRSSAGIGGGARGGSAGTIVISGGIVSATAVSGGSGNGAGIGDGSNANGGSVTISGGKFLISSSGSSIQANEITITGGYYGKGELKADGNTVYSVAVADGYSVLENTDENTNSTWPVLVNGAGNQYSVTLVLSGGTIKAGYDVTSYTYGDSIDLPISLDDFTYSGECIFDGWYTDSGYTGSKVTSITNSDYGDMTLYARLYSVPTYTVTIPTTAKLGSTATVSADNVTLADGTSLIVKLTGASGTGNALTVTSNNGTGTDSLSYTLSINGGSAITAADNNTILTIESGTIEDSKSATLAFSTPLDVAKFSGTYKGTLTFTVSVKDN